MYLNRIDDPRSPIDKAHRQELISWAKRNGITQIDGISVDHKAMNAIILRRYLKARGLHRIPIPERLLGAQNQARVNEQPATEVDADDDMMRQMQREAEALAPKARPPRLVERPKQEINLLRDECKRLGIKMDRRDNKETLKAKIDAHAQDATGLLQ